MSFSFAFKGCTLLQTVQQVTKFLGKSGSRLSKETDNFHDFYVVKKIPNAALNRLTPEEFQGKAKTPIALVLDNVRSLLNIGSVFRTADAFLVDRIYLCGITATPPHRDIEKTALGATRTVTWEYFKDPAEAIAKLKEESFLVYGMEQVEGGIMLNDFFPEPGKKYAMVFGHEVTGLSEEILPLLEGCIEIPQFGTKHSLNIAVCAGIVTWDVFSKMTNG